MNRKHLSLFGLKYHPFRPDIPLEALLPLPVVEAFSRRVEFTLADGGFIMITGDSGTRKSVALRLLAWIPTDGSAPNGLRELVAPGSRYAPSRGYFFVD